jgi:hypothetical protein
MPSKTSAQKSHKCRGKIAGRGKRGRFGSNADNLSVLLRHWETKLTRMGLSMVRGHDPHKLTYGHMIADLDFDGRVTYKPPTGERLENDEWPISLC